jgi:hypothetical protein
MLWVASSSARMQRRAYVYMAALCRRVRVRVLYLACRRPLCLSAASFDRRRCFPYRGSRVRVHTPSCPSRVVVPATRWLPGRWSRGFTLARTGMARRVQTCLQARWMKCKACIACPASEQVLICWCLGLGE